MAKSTLQTFSEYLQALIFALFMAVIIRSFVFEPFKIPSPSMVPTLMVGDHIFVKRYAYGLRVPFTKSWLVEFDGPQRGDVVVFTEPQYEKDDYIKRVVGLPGDKVAMKLGVVYINGKKSEYKEVKLGAQKSDDQCELEILDKANYPEEFKPFPYYYKHQSYKKYFETLPGSDKPHLIQQRRRPSHFDDFEIIVPPRHYFVLGDNRDNSADSRVKGPIPRENLKGKAVKIWLSLNAEDAVCPYDSLYGWTGPAIDFVLTPLGLKPFGGRDVAPSVRWSRFWHSIL